MSDAVESLYRSFVDQDPAEAIAVIERARADGLDREQLFADDFQGGTDHWRLYGPAETTITKDGLRRRNRRVRHADTMIWTKREFEGNFLVVFAFTPTTAARSRARSSPSVVARSRSAPTCRSPAA